jgi:hypothetical protein
MNKTGPAGNHDEPTGQAKEGDLKDEHCTTMAA